MKRPRPIIVLALAAVGSSLLALVLLGPALLPARWLGPWLARRIAPALAAPVAIEAAEIRPWSGITLRGVRIGPPPGFRGDVLVIDRAELAYAPGSLVAGRLRVERLEVVGVRLRLERAERTWNVAALAGPSEGPPASEVEPFRWPLAVELSRFALRDLRVTVDASSHFTSGPIGIEGSARGVATAASLDAVARWRPGATGRLGGDAVRVDGRGNLDATVSLDWSRGFTTWPLALRWTHALRAAASDGDTIATRGELHLNRDPKADRLSARLDALEVGTSSLAASLDVRGLAGWLDTDERAHEDPSGRLEGRFDGQLDLAATLARLPGVASADGLLRFDRLVFGARGDARRFEPIRASGTLAGDRVQVAAGSRRVAVQALRLEFEPSEGRGDVAARLGLRGLDLEAAELAVRGGAVDAVAERVLEAAEAAWRGGDSGGLGWAGSATVTADRLATNEVAARTLRASAVLRTPDLLAQPFPRSLRARVRLRAAGLRAAGIDARAFDATVAAQTAEPDSLDASGRVEAGALRAAEGSARTVAAAVEARVEAGRLDAARLTLTAGRVDHPTAGLEGLQVGIRAAPAPGPVLAAGPIRVLARARVDAAGGAERLEVRTADPPFRTSASFQSSATVDGARGALERSRVDFELGVGASGSASASADARGLERLEARLAVPDLARLTTALPAEWWPGSVQASGGVGVEIDVARAPGGAGDLRGRGTVRLDQLRARGQGIRVAALSGRLRARYDGPAVMAADADLRAEAVEMSEQGRIEGLVVTGSASRDRRGVRVRAAVDGAAGRSDATGLELAGARVRLDAHHPVGEGVRLRRLEVDLPAAGIAARVAGRLRPAAYGAWQPELAVSSTVSAAHLRAAWPSLRAGDGRLALRLAVAPVALDRWRLTGQASADELALETASWSVRGLKGRLPFEQVAAVEPPRYRPAVASAAGFVGDGFEARAREFLGRMATARLVLDRRDILVDAPVTADYQALRPYAEPPAPDVVADALRIGATSLSDLVFEADYGSGLFRVRRLAFGVWQGDVLLDAALQLTSDQDLRLRTRGTATGVNLDIPYAAVEGREPELDDSGTGPYTTTGVLDLRFAVRERQLNGTVDLERVTKKLLERAFGALELQSARSALRWLDLSERFGVRPEQGKIWISNNLLSAEFDWQRLWVHVGYRSAAPWDLLVDTFFIVGRLATVPTVGASIINIVNSAVRRFSIGNLIDRAVDESGLLRLLATTEPFVAPPPEPGLDSRPRAGRE